MTQNPSIVNIMQILNHDNSLLFFLPPSSSFASSIIKLIFFNKNLLKKIFQIKHKTREKESEREE